MTNTADLSARILTAAASGDPRALAGALAASLVKDTRVSGATFTKFSDDLTTEADELASRISRAAHGDAMPDDWIYSQLGAVLEAVEADGEDADVEPAYMTSALLDWLQNGPDAMFSLDEYVSEYGWPDGGLTAALMGAQSQELRNMCAAVWAELESIVEEFAAEVDGEAETDE